MPWRVIAFGFICNLSSAFGQTHFISLFNAQIRESFELGHGSLGVLYSVATLGSAALLPWAGKLIDSVHLRRYSATVVCGLGAAAILMYFANTSWQLFFVFFMLRLFGQGLSSHTGMTTTARLATHKRGKSLSLAGLGMSIGEATAPTLVALLLVVLVWREVWLVAAAVQFFVVLWVTQALLSKLPGAPVQQNENVKDEFSWTRKQVLGDKRFWLVAPALFAPPCVVTALFFNQYSLAEYKNVDFALWTVGVAGYSAGSVLASLVAGVLTDKFGSMRVVKWILLPLILSVLLAGYGDFVGLSVVYYGLMGMSAGISVPAVGALWAEMYGTAHLGAVRSMSHAVAVLFSAIGPIVYGFLLDAAVSWQNILLLTAAWMVFATILLWFTPLQYRAAKK
ncbi:MAG: MFS transporter [Gammaproteobacteria bacterium WSBS_2016_MAG_OTU1]